MLSPLVDGGLVWECVGVISASGWRFSLGVCRCNLVDGGIVWECVGVN
jgi:hypothetical protein